MTADVTDVSNEVASASRTLLHDVIMPVISIDVIAMDDVINSLEDDAPVLISGQTIAVSDGQTVTVSLNNQSYQALVDEQNWSVSISAEHAQALPEMATVDAMVTNLDGLSAQASRTVQHTVLLPTISIDPISEDNLLTSDEGLAGISISGDSSAVEDGRPVSLSINNQVYSVSVDDNRWQVLVPAADVAQWPETVSVNAQVSNLAGDQADDSVEVAR